MNLFQFVWVFEPLFTDIYLCSYVSVSSVGLSFMIYVYDISFYSCDMSKFATVCRSCKYENMILC